MKRERHAHTEPVPAEALLEPDPELCLVWAPLHDDAPGCQYEACADDDVCTCVLVSIPAKEN